MEAIQGPANAPTEVVRTAIRAIYFLVNIFSGLPSKEGGFWEKEVHSAEGDIRVEFGKLQTQIKRGGQSLTDFNLIGNRTWKNSVRLWNVVVSSCS